MEQSQRTTLMIVREPATCFQVFKSKTDSDMTDSLGFGKEKRRQGNLDILQGKATFRLRFVIFLCICDLMESSETRFVKC
jgi:hypothetical protein